MPTMTADGPLDTLATRRDRFFLLAGLFGICGVAWAYTIALAHHGTAHGPADLLLGVQARPWTAGEFGTTFVMWGVMMLAMMAPMAAPMLLALARIARAQPDAPGPLLPAAGFLLGYLGVWTGFSLAATLAQGQLHELALVSVEGASREPLFAGVLLLWAGAFQLTPFKQACLTRCRSPLLFLMSAWQPGAWGGLRMGFLHGGFCLGCCWALMTLMFVGGSMNLLWCAGLMLLMLAEKLLPPGRAVSHAAGIGLMLWGSYVLVAGLAGG